MEFLDRRQPNNGNRQKPRNSSTNTRALSTRLQQLESESRSLVVVRPARSNPPAKTVNSRVYVPRNLRVSLSGSGDVVLAASQVLAAMGKTGTDTVKFKLRGLKVWNVTPVATNSNYVRARLSSSALLLTEQLCSGEDYGTTSNLPGVKFLVPDQLAKSFDGVASGSSQLVTLSGYAVAPTSPSVQNYCLDLSVWVVDEDN